MGALFAQSESPSPSGSSPPYTPAVPVQPVVTGGYGGWGGYHASTAAEGAMRGMASVVRAAGDYNLSTSAAAINMSQARRQEIQNAQDFTNAYFDMRKVNREARAAERAPRASQEELIRIAQAGVPKRPTSRQLDPVSGKIHWPALLQTSPFDKPRGELDRAFSQRAQYGALDYEELQTVSQAAQAMLDQLAEQVASVPPADYIAAKRFLQSLAYEARQPAS